jgi:hypothetical protein
MVYDLFVVLLGSICKYFIEDFCIYVHSVNWPITLPSFLLPFFLPPSLPLSLPPFLPVPLPGFGVRVILAS